MNRKSIILIIAGLVVLMCIIVNLMQQQVIREQAKETLRIDSVIDSLETANRELGTRIDEISVQMKSIRTRPENDTVISE